MIVGVFAASKALRALSVLSAFWLLHGAQVPVAAFAFAVLSAASLAFLGAPARPTPALRCAARLRCDCMLRELLVLTAATAPIERAIGSLATTLVIAAAADEPTCACFTPRPPRAPVHALCAHPRCSLYECA